MQKEKKDLNEKRVRDDELKNRLSTEISLLPELKEDRLAASRLLLYRNITSTVEFGKRTIRCPYHWQSKAA